MKLSDTSKDFERIEEEAHVIKILNALDRGVPKYFNEITALKNQEVRKLPISEKFIWSQLLNNGVTKFYKESGTYEDFFSEERMDVFEEIDDPKTFKSELRKNCPIIRKSLMSKMEVLQKWKEDFARANATELLVTFGNFLDFVRTHVDVKNDVKYNELNSYEDFYSLHEFSDDKDLILRNVIGAGIKTTIIYNLFPMHFCKSVRRTLYGLYFLTEDLHNILPSRTSEFIMLDDKDYNLSKRNSQINIKMEHNYWYPFNLFMLYTNHIYKILEKLLGDIGLDLDKENRFVYVNIFLELICLNNDEAVKTMMGGDQDL